MNIFTVKPGTEQIASAEITAAGGAANLLQNGLLTADPTDCKYHNFCFPSWHFLQVTKNTYDKYNTGIDNAVSWYCESIRSERIEKNWPLVYLVFSENGFIPDFTKARIIVDFLKKRMSRIAKLAITDYPPMNVDLNGLFIVETDNNCMLLSRMAHFYGQRRMKHDPLAPSRSYLKIEEAFSVFAKQPLPGEVVVDLGAAPGGWSYSAAKRGAHVIAVDNGPLKKGASNNILIEHIREDAFLYKPDKPVDWLFCDMVEDPFRVINVVKTWLNKHLCRYAVVNFKYGYSDPFKLLGIIKSKEGLLNSAENMVCRHLFHDRDEITVMMSAVS